MPPSWRLLAGAKPAPAAARHAKRYRRDMWGACRVPCRVPCPKPAQRARACHRQKAHNLGAVNDGMAALLALGMAPTLAHGTHLSA